MRLASLRHTRSRHGLQSRLQRPMPGALIATALCALGVGLVPSAARATPVDWPCSISGTFTVDAGAVTANDTCTGAAAIPDNVTAINDEVFAGATGLTAVTFGAGSGLTSIGGGAFADTGLTSITIPAGVTAIGGRAFANTTGLAAFSVAPSSIAYGTVGGVLTNAAGTEIVAYPAGRSGPYTIPAGITAIADTAFAETTLLTAVTVPAGLTSIGGEAFSGARGLTTITFAAGSGLTSIGPYAFYYATALTGITIPASVTSIGYGAFGSTTSLATVAFAPGSNLTAIPFDTFNGATALTSITIPQGVTSIGERAFEGATSLASAAIPASVTTIGEPAFAFDTSLAAFTVDPANPNYASVNGVLMNRAGTRLVEYPAGRAGAYTVPAGVTAIGVGAFGGAASLTRLTIPEGITSIGIGAFSHATALTELTIPSTVTSISGWTFDSATSLTTVTLPASITSIGTNAFIGTSGLVGIQFLGNAPATIISGAFNGATASALRFPTATGFGAGPTWRGLTLGYWMPSPAAPTAVAGLQSATITVTTSPVGPTPTSFTVRAVEDPSKTCTITGASGSCAITDLTAGTAYRFVATATDGNATSAASAASSAVTPTGPPTPAPAVPAAAEPSTPATPSEPAGTTPGPLRQAPPRRDGDAIVTTGLVPDGATSVVQKVSGGVPRAASRAHAVTRVVVRCPITARGSVRTYRCSAHLGAGRWTLTTQARAGSTVIAQSVRRIVVAPVRRTAVTG